MFYAANWFIELINSFSTQQEEDIMVKVMVRLKQVLDLQKTMAELEVNYKKGRLLTMCTLIVMGWSMSCYQPPG